MLVRSSVFPGHAAPQRERERDHERLASAVFDVSSLPAASQLLAWRERAGQFVDVEFSRAMTRQPFIARFERFVIGEYVFLDCYSDAVAMVRPIARISRDSARSMTFHIFFRGDPASIVRHRANRHEAPANIGMLAVDLEQPLRWARKESWHVNIFVPKHRLAAFFPDPGILHGRHLIWNAPTMKVIAEKVERFSRAIHHLTEREARVRMDDIVQLIAHAYGADIGLGESAQAIAREAAVNHARRYVQEHLFDSDLTPERVLAASGLSRASVYRLFEHEGGLAAYIRDLRVRAAAADLVRMPDLAVKDIAYSVGFKSATDFSRAFRRAFDATPQDIRAYVPKNGLSRPHADDFLEN